MSKGTAVLGIVLAFVGGYFVGVYSHKGGAEGDTAEMAATTASTEVERVRVPVGPSPARGAKEAKVTIIEFSDFQ